MNEHAKCMSMISHQTVDESYMTDEERRNRNPKPEIATGKLEDFPELRVSDLEIHRVYILHSPQHLVTMNYMGIVHTLDRKTLDAIVVHHFRGPRANLDVYLSARSDGALEDGAGNRIVIRKYTGPDA